MQRILQQIVICQSRRQYKNIYVRVESEEVFISPTIQITASKQVKCQISLPLSQKYPLSIQIWNYQPHQQLKSWYFQKKEVMCLKDKHMMSEDDWVIYIKKTERQKENKENKYRNNKSRSTDKQRLKYKNKSRGSNVKDSKQRREQIKFILENKKNSKQSIKKTLKNTIHYLIKQQSLVNQFQHYGIPDEPPRFKTAKCTPAQQISNLKNYSTLFSEYGLNMSQAPALQNSNSQTCLGQSKKKTIKAR